MVSLPDDTQADISDAFNTVYRQLDEILNINEPVHEISNTMVCATRKPSVQPAHMRSLIRAFASRLGIL